VELKSKNNNKDIYENDSLLDCKIKFEPLHSKREIPQGINCQRYGHTKVFVFVKRDASSAQKTTQPSTDHAGRNPRILHESSHPPN